MLTVYSTKGGDAAKAYFFSGLVHGDYYAEGQERVGQWWGKGAEILNLRGPVQTREFCRLVDNQHPETKARLTLRNKLDRRAGYDLTFSPCKSLSILALLLGDERLVQAVRKSVIATLEEAERLIQTRVRKDGQIADRFTNNLVAALFPHLTARPEGGQVPDPQVHIHAYLINATFDTLEHTWKALQAFQVKFNAPFLEALFHNDLARRVQELGYEVTGKGKFWEIKGVPQEAITVFSKRGEKVNAVASARGITDPEEKAGLAAKTRRGKAPEHTLSELRDKWWSQLPKSVADRLIALRPDSTRFVPLSDKAVATEAQRIVQMMAATSFERSSTITENRFLERCLRKSLGRVGVDDLRAAIQSASLEVKDYKGVRRVTHPLVYREEQQIVEAVKKGKGLFAPLQSKPEPPEGLTQDQVSAFKHIVTSRDRFTIVEGRPGTGKTRLTVAANEAMTGRLRDLLSPLIGDKVVFLAPTTIASRGVLRDEGFKDADTVARFMMNKKLQEKATGGWVWVDEASQLGTRDGNSLVKLLTHLGCRAVFCGDRKQTRSVSRGSTLDVMIDHGGCQSQQMEEIVRQKGRLKEIINTIVQGNVKKGLDALSKDGDLHVLPSGVCERAAAEEYVRRTGAKEKVSLITPTHAGAKHVTACVRDEMRAAGRIKSERTIRTWVDSAYTVEQKRETESYKLGQMVQFNRPVAGFERGKQYEVVNVSPFSVAPFNKQVIVRGKGEVAEALPMRQANCWTVYDPEEIQVGKGDMIRITRTTMAQTVLGQFRARVIDQFDLPEKSAAWKRTELANGSAHRIAGFALNGDIVLEGQIILPKEYGHLTHGYCRTVQTAQSITTDAALLVGTRDQLPAVNGRSFLVAVSRPRSTLKVYTDDLDALHTAASQWSTDIGAYELVEKGQEPSVKNLQAQREHAELEAYLVWQHAQGKKGGHER